MEVHDHLLLVFLGFFFRALSGPFLLLLHYLSHLPKYLLTMYNITSLFLY